MKVFVKNMRGQALMPCSPRKARILLKQKKAKIVSYKPFTIQLCYATGEARQEVIVVAVRYSINRVGIHLTAFASLSGGRLLPHRVLNGG